MEHRISHDDVLSFCLILVQIDVIRQNYATEDLTFDTVVSEEFVYVVREVLAIELVRAIRA